MKSQAIAPQETQAASLLSVIERAASNPDVDIAKMERLLAMHERAKAQQAEQQFAEAMNRAQSRMERIAHDSNNPQTRSRYTSYAGLDRALRPIYTGEGFSVSFDTGPSATTDVLELLCYVTHAAGHTRTYRLPMPADGKGAKGGDVMTKTHATGAAMTYGRRYLLGSVFNVAFGADDNDGNRPRPKATAAPTGDEFAEDEKALLACGTLAELATVWNAMSKDAHAALESVKDGRKRVLQLRGGGEV